MNVVLLPAFAGVTASVSADGFPCFQGACLLSWAWSILALTLLSAWVVRRWHSGSNDDAIARLAPVAASRTGAAFLPRASGVAAPSRAALPRTDVRMLAASSLGLRAPPTTDMAAAPPLRTPRNAHAGPSSPSRRSIARSPGTPTEPDPSGPPGRLPPA